MVCIGELSSRGAIDASKSDRVTLRSIKGEALDYRRIMDLSGKSAVITGGASGIGLAAAQALGSCGARLELLDVNLAKLETIRSRLIDEGLKVSVRVLDVTDPKAVADVAAEIKESSGPIDILVNSAGIAHLHSATEVSDEDWCRVMDVNVNGTFWCCREFGKGMVEAGRGSIVNMGSMSGNIVNRPQFASSYMASKGAVHQITRALAVEWAKTGVRINAIAPGYIGTEMTLEMRSRPELFDVWLDMTPMGRCGEPSEVASVILFLSSTASSYMTGAIVPVDGGYTSL